MDHPLAQPEGAPQAAVTGTVKTWDSARAFGWVEAGRSTFFLHVADIVGRIEPRPGQLVKFMPIRTPRGLRAVLVEILEEGS